MGTGGGPGPAPSVPALAAVHLGPVNTGAGVLLPVLWLFLSVLVTFVLTRVVTRSIRHRSDRGGAGGGIVNDIHVGGVHVHHAVPGIVLMAVAGVALVAATPEGVALSLWAVVLGIGLSLAFDEFALWLHLDDVYWSETGRVSVDAVFCIVVVTGLLFGFSDLLPGDVGGTEWWAFTALLVVRALLGLVCLAKGKPITAVVGMVLFLVVLVGAVRLAKPGSPWARRRYAGRPRRLARAQRRFGPAYTARWNRRRDLVAGSPTARPVPPETSPPETAPTEQAATKPSPTAPEQP